MGDVLAVVEQRDGKIRGVSNEVVSAAGRIASGLGGSVHALLLGGPGLSGEASGLGRFGAEKVRVGEMEALSGYHPEGYAQVVADGIATREVAVEALSKLEVDPIGLDEIDHKVLHTIIDRFNGGPVGLDTIASSISEEADTIMDVYEPYLLQLGFLERTPRGRMATHLAYEHLGLPYDKEKPPQQTLL